MAETIAGTTPTFTLTFNEQDLDLTQASHVYVTISGDDGTPIVTKKDGQLTVEAKSISVFLTQAETLPLADRITLIRANWTYQSGGVTRRACSKKKLLYWEPNEMDMVIE